ncbi:helix-turn-helix domain-containing protein [Streptomyces diacarni]|uniref:helix-turn-helix domain-containing protein n=1 Tax=Streptomyces diacarni TaxID=2800381 RepID=UPI0015F06597|nr:helix-turn-helix domain-containing protein [Streptomyces diacarni]
MQTTQQTETGAYVVSAARAFALLAALAELEEEEPGAHRLGVIARRAGLSPSQTNKLLAQAEEHGLVRRTGYGRYALSPKAAATDAAARPATAGPSARPAGHPAARPSASPAARSATGTARPPAAMPVTPAVRRARALTAGGAKASVTGRGSGPAAARERPAPAPVEGAACARTAPVFTVPAR